MAEITCLVHVGTGKTGSTAIQYALVEARQYLAAKGVDYPDLSENLASAVGGKATAGNGILLFKALQGGDVAEAVGLVRTGVSGTQSFIISCEGIWQLPRETLVAFAAAIRDLGFRTKALVYFRPQADFWVSSYLQQVKGGKLDWRLDVGDYVRRCLHRLRSKQGRGNWLSVADRLADAFGIDGLTVHWYPSLVSRGDDQLVKSLFAWVGVPPPEGGGAEGMRNPSPNAEALLILRMLNAGGIGGRAFAERFLMLAQDAGLLDKCPMLAKADIQLIDHATRKDNDEMLRRYAPAYAAGETDAAQSVAALDPPRLRQEVVAAMMQLAGRVLAGTSRGV